MPTSKPRIALTLGDPAGIGPEIVAAVLRRTAVTRRARIQVVGHDAVLERAHRALQEPAGKSKSAHPAASCLEPMPLRGKPPSPGRWSKRTGRLSLAYVEAAVDLCRRGEADAVVTAPICKAAWQEAGVRFPGHTELLAARCGVRQVVMLLVGGGLRVALVTIHEPLARVPRLVTTERIVAVGRVLAKELERSFGLERPRLAVLGLNPHAGEEGRLGREEERAIRPAVRRLRRGRIDAVGPLPADTAFHCARSGDYTAVLAMYHDQGLGPLKTVAFDTGVNVTLGLPIVRTSPDHGTAFDIAGRGVASDRSLLAAIHTATDMIEARGGKRGEGRARKRG